jgi:hypothetical protein
MKSKSSKIKKSPRLGSKTKPRLPRKLRKKVANYRKSAPRKRVSKPKSMKDKHLVTRKIVRIMGHGQFDVGARTLKRLDKIDDSLVAMVRMEKFDDSEFKKRLTELNEWVMKEGKPIDSKEIIKSDIILPSVDLSIDEAKRLFRDGVIPEM